MDALGSLIHTRWADNYFFGLLCCFARRELFGLVIKIFDGYKVNRVAEDSQSLTFPCCFRCFGNSRSAKIAVITTNSINNVVVVSFDTTFHTNHVIRWIRRNIPVQNSSSLRHFGFSRNRTRRACGEIIWVVVRMPLFHLDFRNKQKIIRC